MIDSAIAFAALAHAGQKRKYTFDPYIVHPIEVMSIVRTVEPDREDMAVAAVLHDVLEDTPVTEREIERRFGAAVLTMVIGLTKVSVEGSRAERKAAELERLALVPAEVQTIKCADLISNMRTVAKFDLDFAQVYLAEKEAVLAVLTKADAGLHKRAVETLASGLQTLSIAHALNSRLPRA
jgi:(p)ppGpp synthase/HD superfamily hydrolase